MTTPGEVEFDVEGQRFRVGRLSPDDACRGLEVLGKVLGPAALEVFSARGSGSSDAANADGSNAAGNAAAAPNYGAILAALVANASQLAVLLNLFAPRAKFFRAIGGAWVDLKPFTAEVFGGRLDVLVAFLFHAVRAEYASFLSGGSALTGLLEQLGASSSPSPTAPTA